MKSMLGIDFSDFVYDFSDRITYVPKGVTTINETYFDILMHLTDAIKKETPTKTVQDPPFA